MPKGLPDPKELGFYFALAQVGLEMVVPIGLGLAGDNYLNWTPWGVIVGAILGLIVGMVHLVALVGRDPGEDSSKPRQPT